MTPQGKETEMPTFDPMDVVSQAVLALEAAGWTIKDADRDSVWMTSPTGMDIEIQASDLDY